MGGLTHFPSRLRMVPYERTSNESSKVEARKPQPTSGQKLKRPATMFAAASVLAIGTLTTAPAMAAVDDSDPDVPTEVTLVEPNITQAECINGNIIGPYLSGNHGEGVTYVFDASQIMPGATVIVTAMPAEGYVLADSDDWTMLDSGEATFEVEYEDIDCEEDGGEVPADEETPEPETEDPVEEAPEPESEPSTEKPADTEQEDEVEKADDDPTHKEDVDVAASEQQLEATGAPAAGLMALAGLSGAAGALVRRIRGS